MIKKIYNGLIIFIIFQLEVHFFYGFLYYILIFNLYIYIYRNLNKRRQSVYIWKRIYWLIVYSDYQILMREVLKSKLIESIQWIGW